MTIGNKFNNQSGLSLIEILAALVILGIVFIGIMTVFPQMTLFNQRTDAKLDTMNLARYEMQRLEMNAETISLDSDETLLALYNSSDYSEVEIIHSIDFIELSFNNEGYRYEFIISKIPVESLTENNQDLGGQKKFHNVILSIKLDGSVRSKTYGYLQQM